MIVFKLLALVVGVLFANVALTAPVVGDEVSQTDSGSEADFILTSESSAIEERSSPTDLQPREPIPTMVCNNPDAPSIANFRVRNVMYNFCKLIDGKVAAPGLWPIKHFYPLGGANVTMWVNNNSPTTPFLVKNIDCVNGISKVVWACLKAGTGGQYYNPEQDVYWVFDVNHASMPWPYPKRSIGEQDTPATIDPGREPIAIGANTNDTEWIDNDVTTSSELARRQQLPPLMCDGSHTAPREALNAAVSQFCYLNGGHLIEGEMNQAFPLSSGGKVAFGVMVPPPPGLVLDTDWCMERSKTLLDGCSHGAAGYGGLVSMDEPGPDGIGQIRFIVSILPDSKQLARRQPITCDFSNAALRRDVDAAASQFCTANGDHAIDGRISQGVPLSGGGSVNFAVTVPSPSGTVLHPDWCVESFSTLLDGCSIGAVAQGGFLNTPVQGVSGMGFIQFSLYIVPASKKLARRTNQEGLDCHFNQPGWEQRFDEIWPFVYEFCSTHHETFVPPGETRLMDRQIPNTDFNHAVDVGITVLDLQDGYNILGQICQDALEGILMDCSAGMPWNQAVGGSLTRLNGGAQWFFAINNARLLPDDYEPPPILPNPEDGNTPGP
ncbi:hypothetical protein LTR53_015382 [Teratosphaeriaceae sp. CCFEE 6253]|nr:hypothetical protein LTR53_015382 [Teratosphaeriaceae sp. CCFEE 6253]